MNYGLTKDYQTFKQVCNFLCCVEMIIWKFPTVVSPETINVFCCLKLAVQLHLSWNLEIFQIQLQLKSFKLRPLVNSPSIIAQERNVNSKQQVDAAREKPLRFHKSALKQICVFSHLISKLSNLSSLSQLSWGVKV